MQLLTQKVFSEKSALYEEISIGSGSISWVSLKSNILCFELRFFIRQGTDREYFFSLVNSDLANTTRYRGIDLHIPIFIHLLIYVNDKIFV